MTGKRLVYLDANVLIPSVTRGLLIIGAATSDFRVGWSAYGEAEAERHQHARAAKISDLRRRFRWDSLVPEVEVAELVDTDPKDRPHLASAHAAGARLIVTDNIKDFGLNDLRSLSMSAVTPDLFLSERLSESTYVGTLTVLARGRTREPRNAAGIHGEEVTQRLPAVAERFASTFDTALPLPVSARPHRRFHGFRCVRCEAAMTSSASPLCDICRRS